jgi:branched-chain amino acid transport system permease protein
MSALGYPVFWLRVTVFLIAALYAGVGGILAAWSSGIITPTALQMSRTIWILLVVILGGAAHFWGPVLGTVIAVWLDVLVSQLTPRYSTVIGVVFLAVILVAPNGILGVLERLKPWRVSRAAGHPGPGGPGAGPGRWRRTFFVPRAAGAAQAIHAEEDTI